MKTLLTILLITSHFCFLGQRAPSEKIVKSGKNFGNRTEYFYDANGHMIEERFYEGEEFVLDVLTKYKYTPEGMLSKKIQRDFRGSRRGKKDVFRYEVRYWEIDKIS